ncbi:GbsR/MarR family transcriptional regulator [Streptomyces sp. NPDC096105]|uniref:GbsR/MarR family transcriptional regulator n=1 Tax=Streptomyces sp. NPDC096105 TaxID=3366074 RepID=UPI00380E3638
MTASTATSQELEFVEAVALQLEQQGLIRMSGRAIGWLLICDPAEQTLGQIAEALSVSVGSISTALRHLVPSQLVERFRRPGERGDRYRINPHAWIEHAMTQASRYGEFKRVTARGLELLAGEPPVRSRRLQEMYDFYEWLEREMPLVWSRWEQEKKERMQHDPCGAGRGTQ